MQVEYLPRISLLDEGWDVSVLEEPCWKAGREASQRLFLVALGQRDNDVVALAERESREKVRRYLVTKFGVLAFRREKVRHGGVGAAIPWMRPSVLSAYSRLRCG